MDVYFRKDCRVCFKKNLIKILSLGTSPLADKFSSTALGETSYSLDLYVCPSCFLVQLGEVVNDQALFGDDYAFFTGASPSSIRYFKTYADDVMKAFPEQSRGFVFEIASNDGILLKHFQEAGAQKVVGIDPAVPAAQYANAHGIQTVIDHFGEKWVSEQNLSMGKASLILANNVVAHVDDLHGFMQGVKMMLSRDGVFVFESHYLPNLLFHNEFDNVYHEHRSFLSLHPIEYLLKENGLKVFDIKEVDTQGGSIRVFVDHIGSSRGVSQNVERMRSYEHVVGLQNIETYLGFQSRVNYIKQELLRILNDLKAKNKKIAGFGASAKSCTLLNFCGIGTNYLDYIVDMTPYKIGKLSPGMHIPVVSPEMDTQTSKPDYYLLLVWNYLEGIMKREKSYLDDGGHFIIPMPVPYLV